jgi:hypothetical protein
MVGTVSCYWSLLLSLLNLHCKCVVTFELEIIHFAGSEGVGLFYRKVFPHRQISVLCVSFSLFYVCLLALNL